MFSDRDWDFIEDGLVNAELAAVLADSCMDIIQTLAQTILDVVMLQVYRQRRTCATFSPTVLSLTEGQIHAYLGDSIQQALANSLRLPVQTLGLTKVFAELLVRHISKTVNSVLALSTQTSILESRVPVFFVSGCQTLLQDLRYMVGHIAAILIASLNHPEVTEAQSSQTASFEHRNLLELESPVFCFSTKNGLKGFLKTYITRMVNVLKRAHMQNRESRMSSSNRRDVCIIVGSNTQILTVEDIEAHEQSAKSSYSGLDVIPGAVPDNDDAPSEANPFSSVTVIDTTEDTCPDEADTIKNIADELVKAVLGGDQQEEAETDSCQESGNDGLAVVYCSKLKELTDRIFHLVMSGQDYQIPYLPVGMRMCDSVTYRKLRRGGVTNPGIVTQALYMRTEELVSRCAVQALIWSTLDSLDSDLLFGYSSQDPSMQSSESGFQPVPAAGDCEPTVPRVILPAPRHLSNSTFDIIPEQPEQTQSQLLASNVHTSLLTLLVGEMLARIDIRDGEMILEVAKKAVVQIQDADPKLYDHFHASFMGQSYRDICQTAINDLLLEFGSVEGMKEAVRAGDPNFQEALMRALRKQLFPTPPVSSGNAAKTTTCSFFKKLKRLCCKKTSTSR